MRKGFTLIELAIVLVIIGLIVGGVLVGQDMVRAAGVQATIAQIEKYNTAVNTFREKYGYLPGDIPATPAAQFGLAARGQYPGEGDGNGVIEGVVKNQANQNFGTQEGGGETAMFWVDLSAVNLIDGGFNTASETVVPAGAITAFTAPNIDAYLPQAKLGRGNYLYVYSYNNKNYFGLSAVVTVGGQEGSQLISDPLGIGSLTAQEAWSIDRKIDDGMPLTGMVTAVYVNCCNNSNTLPGSNVVRYAGQSGGPASVGQYAYTANGGGSCYDNNGNAGVQPTYSTRLGGVMLTCDLSFQFRQ